MAEGIEVRQDSKGKRRYRWVVNSKDGKKRGGWVTSQTEAKAGRVKALGEIAAGTAAKASGVTLRQEWAEFYDGAKAGRITDRSGRPYKPATLRGYERAWRKIDPELGAHKLGEIKRADVQRFADRLAASGMAAGTVRNTLDPLRTIYRRAIARDKVAVNPTTNVEVSTVRNHRERIADKEEASALIDALPTGEKALWATAMYTGLRRGELRALRWSDVDLLARLIDVRRSWDDSEGEAEPKTKGSKRKVPVVPVLAKLLAAHQDITKRSGDDLVFGRSASDPFIPTTARARALKAWKAARLTPISLHECRHTAASLMIAAGANAKALSVVMGHADIGITFDRYGHLMPGGEAEVGQRLAAFLAE